MSIKHSFIALGMSALLPLAAQAEAVKQDAQAALANLNSSLATAELDLAVISAEEAIGEVQANEAMAALLASVANAELGIALAQATEAINGVSDHQLLAELDDSLKGADAVEANDLIMAVVAERPMMAALVQDAAINAGLSEQVVASAVFAGLADAPATAAGQ